MPRFSTSDKGAVLIMKNDIHDGGPALKRWLAGLLALMMTAMAPGQALCQVVAAPQARPEAGVKAVTIVQGPSLVMTPEILKRWGVVLDKNVPGNYYDMSQSRREELDAHVLEWEGDRLADVATLKQLVGENWKNFVDANEIPTAEGKKLIERSKSRVMGANSAGMKLAAGLVADMPKDAAAKNGALDNVASKSNSMFDGAVSAGTGVGAAVVDGLGMSGFFTAQAFGDAAIALGNTAQSLGNTAATLGQQAGAAAAAGNLAEAGRLGAQAEQAGAQAAQAGAQAEANGAKAVKAANGAKTLTLIGGGLMVADGIWDIYKGLSDGKKIVEYLKLNESSIQRGASLLPPSVIELLEKKADKADERVVVGGVKIGAGAVQFSSLLVPIELAAYFLYAGAAIYLAAQIYQHREAIAKLFKSIWQWIKSVFGSKAPAAAAPKP
ncbi:MAG TPA: hypothetical protein DEB40_06045 [Elusimicrobia bacterium]|nr:hypothetical protein [Elusimicrobiota bacterium]HBT61288.1 hypothetical protein [Elusimicrobiota bacterium]